jgi:RHH-type proline utilization regulon transcriptional repressor/proline dehydrogenase/delta 1-pyrroline-5-carboxylate dehydrogenase
MLNEVYANALEMRVPVFAKLFRMDETELVNQLLETVFIDEESRKRIQEEAARLVRGVRVARSGKAGIDSFLIEYDLSSDEGIALMCMAEALLRIPDSATRDLLIRDKLSGTAWASHVGKSESSLVNAATLGLMLTGKLLGPKKREELPSVFTRLVQRSSEPLIRQAIAQGMRILGNQFVMGESIDSALKRARKMEKKGYRYSYDMLGEAALTTEDSIRYFDSYVQAIEKIAKENDGRGPINGPGISIKLSALHPRYDSVNRERVLAELLPKVKVLALQAREANIGFTVDAEESHRLMISLEIMESLIKDPDLLNWQGLGIAVQAYQKRACAVLEWLISLTRAQARPIMVRLVKGAYWDTEIKEAQVQAMSGYPVFTRKVATDVNYFACAQLLLDARDVIYPQFATHNAQTVATILELSLSRTGFEFQCLHGMGEALYAQVVGADALNIPCRIYAPVGSHEDLLAYLVRRLLENGANSSFVNRIVDETLPVEEIIADPFLRLNSYQCKPHPNLPLPEKIFGKRKNSKGFDWRNAAEFMSLWPKVEAGLNREWTAKASYAIESSDKNWVKVINPAQHRLSMGLVQGASVEVIAATMQGLQTGWESWQARSVEERASAIESLADKLQDNNALFYSLLIGEAGKTFSDAVSELREAIDFCRYYAQNARELLSHPEILTSVTGETNQLSLHGRGVFVCISPWNFPLAIFTGQIVAALVTGNCVAAKPAPQTPLIAELVIKLLREVGIDKTVVALVPGGAEVGKQLVADSAVAGVIFTGSSLTAKAIQKTLSESKGPVVPFIAETGGQNAMIVDASALPEQVVNDVIQSAFLSAGQRCSALRVLYLQEEIAERTIKMLKGAMAELAVGDPIRLATDLGPVIDEEARRRLELHAQEMEANCTLLAKVSMPESTNQGSFFAPRAYEIKSIKQLSSEVFGPILHVIRYKQKDFAKVIQEINETGYGLTLGVHSRIDQTINFVKTHARVGNLYVNRNIVGAVVESQPFGGEGLSGTGPKAGGPHYLLSFVTERVVTVNTVAAGGNASLMNLSEL